jgi:hypothetical protein
MADRRIQGSGVAAPGGSTTVEPTASGAASAPGSGQTTWVGHAACAWALLFAAANVYWGLGGRVAVPLPDPEAALRDPVVVALNWAAAGLKAGMAVVALATVQRWGRVIPRRLLLIAAYGLGVGMATYGGLGLVADGLRVLGVIQVPEPARTSLWWHLLLWDPWWLVGGILFVAAAQRYRRGGP